MLKAILACTAYRKRGKLQSSSRVVAPVPLRFGLLFRLLFPHGGLPARLCRLQQLSNRGDQNLSVASDDAFILIRRDDDFENPPQRWIPRVVPTPHPTPTPSTMGPSTPAPPTPAPSTPVPSMPAPPTTLPPTIHQQVNM